MNTVKIFLYFQLLVLVFFIDFAAAKVKKSTLVKDRVPAHESNKCSRDDNTILNVYTTAKGTDLKLKPLDPVGFVSKEQPIENEITIFVDPNITFQTILGFGGALTDAVAETYSLLNKELQTKLMQNYFDPENGLGYTLARTSIHSCDFSSESYTYVSDSDKGLKTFDIKHDKVNRIPLIKEALRVSNNNLKILATPWTPPPFMKDNGQFIGGGKLKPGYFQAWADYFVKFIRAYEKEGIPIWGVSIQNEPMADQKWESCVFTAKEETDFLKNYLGPTLEKAKLGETKILGWDHNRDLLFQRANHLLSDPEAAKYLWGIAYHWYESWTGGAPMFDNLKLAKQAFPDMNFLFTEGRVSIKKV